MKEEIGIDHILLVFLLLEMKMDLNLMQS